MKSVTSYTAGKTKKYLGLCLAALVTVSATSAWAQTSDSTLKQLQDENAALRARLAALEGQASAQPATTTTTTTTTSTAAPTAGTAALGTDQGVQTLSPFTVNDEKDHGYLATNSATATKINMQIQKVPMSISIVTTEFMQDTGMRSMMDVLGYTAGTSGDPHFAISIPSNDATPQGTFTLRGFPVNVILRDGILMYSTKVNVDNTDRVELLKGPAAIFFGQGYPGGAINFVTKVASLTKIPNQLSYTFGQSNTNRGLLDVNQTSGGKLAIRVVAGWENSSGDRNGEYQKRIDLTPSIILDPFKNGKLTLTANTSYLNEKFNENSQDWIYQTAWFQAYQNPSQALINAAGLQNSADPVAAYRARIFASQQNWINDVRTAAGNQLIPQVTSVVKGGYFTDASGVRQHNETFSFNNPGSFYANDQTTSTFAANVTPFDWFSLKYSLTQDQSNFSYLQSYMIPNADGLTYNAANGYAGAQYNRKTRTHQIDSVFTVDTFGLKNKFLVGYVLKNLLQQYATAMNGTPDYKLTPGYNYPTINPNTSLTAGDATRNVPVNQVIKDRNGNVLAASQVFTTWDPGTQVAPNIAKTFDGWANPYDGYPSQYNAWYTNYQGTMWNDRLTLLGGFRQETYRQAPQALTGNFPWFSPPVGAFGNTTLYPENVYNYSAAYQSTTGLTQTGNSYMAGLSFEVVKGVNVYVSYSKTFRYNSNTPYGGNGQSSLGGRTDANDPTFQNYVNPILANNPNGFVFKYYNGGTTLIKSVADAAAAEIHDGANTLAPNEEGTNIEGGVKLTTDDSKLVGTFSIFKADRNNQLVDDVQHQGVDSLNYTNTTGNPSNIRAFRWRSTAHNQIQGTEAEVIWSPNRNFQLLTNASWYWTAKTLSDSSVAPTNVVYNIYFGNRIENVPEYRANAFGKYTFSDGFLRGLGIGLGARYASTAVLQRSQNYNPSMGGLEADNFLVWAGTVSYPYELYGYQFVSQFNLENIFSKKYIDGGGSTTAAYPILAPTANWTLTTTLKF